MLECAKMDVRDFRIEIEAIELLCEALSCDPENTGFTT